MAFLGERFSVDDLPPSERNFEPIPAGMYQAVIKAADMKKTKAGGDMVTAQFLIVGPAHQGRVVFANFNIKNTSEVAETIGRQQLGELLRATGKNVIEQTDELIGATCDIKVAIKPAAGQYEAGNEIKGYRAAAGGMPSIPQAQEKPAASTQPAPPWAK